MRKTILTLAIGTFSLVSFGQNVPEMKLSKEGFQPVVVEVPNKTKEEIYKSLNEFLQLNYKNPEKVQKGNIENEYIRWEGFKEKAWSYKTIGITQQYDMAYTIEIDVKDNRYRYSYTVTDFYSNGQKPLFFLNAMFNKEGQPRKVYSESVKMIEEGAEDLNQQMLDYIVKGNQRNSDW